MLSKAQDGWSLVLGMPNELLKDIPHFVGFFQIVVLKATYINEKKNLTQRSKIKKHVHFIILPDSYQLFVELLHG